MTLLDEYRNWHDKIFVLLEIIKQAKNREIALLGYKGELDDALAAGGLKKGFATRNINASFLDIAKLNFDRYEFWDRRFRLYISLATFIQGKYPMFSFSKTERKMQQAEFVRNFMANPADFIAGFDFALEIDSLNQQEGMKQAKRIKEIFDQFQLPYSLKPSAGKLGGWHYQIAYEHFKQYFKPLEMVKATYILNKELKELENLPDIDTSIFDCRRIWKASYSLCFGNNKQWNVCLPLDDEQFENFSFDRITPKAVLEQVHIKNRGLLERKSSSTSVKDFISEWYEPAKNDPRYKSRDERIMGDTE